MKCAVLFRRALGGQHAVFLLKRDAVRDREGKFALRPLHVDLVRLHGDLYACWHSESVLCPIRDIFSIFLD